MSKLDKFRATTGELSASLGVGRAPGTPHGFDEPAIGGASGRAQGVERDKRLNRIEIGRITPDPDQPRKEFDEEAIGRLAESMRVKGQLQPISVYWDQGQGAYVILVGERRYRAARLAGLSHLSCVVLDARPEPGERLALQAIENLLREDLTPIEQARAYRELMRVNGWGVNELARGLHVPASAVSQALALLELPAAIQEKVDVGDLAASVGYQISRLDDSDAQVELAARVVAEGMTRDEVAAAVRTRAGGKGKGRGAGKGKPPKVTARTFRTPAGPRVTVEWARGLTAESMRSALRDALATLDAEAEGRGEAA